ncbi:hypothetical protein CCAX7_13460 [Capsulimonas corticalis]|uniref:Uncharacterized protein n=1 Tax=Capsulimonas corticalis TaxID=2219043 RepID=A0A402D4M5_9BACT|nr:RHS repeat-associated core domain-containing protein [Capsulimonas corticalis]BDI29295.1 hypothetical protein CCAX7_13460 [Capsulimonas corticalis]
MFRAYTRTDYQYPGGPVSRTGLYPEADPTTIPVVGATPFRYTDYTYTADGETASVAGTVEPASYTYDGLSRVVTLKDGNNHVTNYSYDPAGNLAQIQYPGASGVFDTLTFAYDGDQNLTSRTDGRGFVTTYNRSSVDNRVDSVTYSSDASLNVSYSYDALSRMIGMSSTAAAHTYTLDNLGLPMTHTTSFTGGPQNQTLTYAYNPDGSRTTLQTPSFGTGGSYNYQYNGVGDLTRAGFPWTGGSVNHVYQTVTGSSPLVTSGRLSQSRSARGTTNYTYDPRGFLGTLSNLWKDYPDNPVSNAPGSLYGGSRSGASLTSDMTYDTGGNRLVEDSYVLSAQGVIPYLHDGSRTRTFTYDSRDRLTHENSLYTGSVGTDYLHAGYDWSFSYDNADNPLTMRGASLASPNSDNQFFDGGANYVYDGNGNPTKYMGVSGLTFDAEDRLTAIPSPTFSATYGPDGLRVKKSTSLGDRYFLYDGDQLLLEEDSAGAIKSAFGWAADGLRAQYIPGDQYYLYEYDPSGNLVQVQSATNSAARFLNTSLYDAYGNVRNSLGDTNGVSSSALAVIGFGGQYGYYTDNDRGGNASYNTGLLLLTHRYYDPRTGRFINRDPIGYQGGVNLYGFAGGNPVNESDPSGTSSKNSIGDWLDGKVGGAVTKAGYDWEMYVEGKTSEAQAYQSINNATDQFTLLTLTIASEGLTADGEALNLAAMKAENRTVAAAVSFTGDDLLLARYGSRVPPLKGYFDVVVHGTPNSFELLSNTKWIPIDQRALATIISKSGYKGGPVRLISCSTGALTNGIAKNLANKLGAEVIAPDMTVYVHGTGKLTIGSVSKYVGKWVHFYPGK